MMMVMMMMMMMMMMNQMMMMMLMILMMLMVMRRSRSPRQEVSHTGICNINDVYTCFSGLSNFASGVCHSMATWLKL